MATISKRLADDLIAGNGRMVSNQEDAPDNPRATRIVEYIDQGGQHAYGVTFHGDDINKYLYPSPFIRNPVVIWQAKP